MIVRAKESELWYKTVPDGAYYYGVTVAANGIFRLLMWNDLLALEGTDREVTLTFRLFDVIVTGSGLLQLLKDAKRHKIDLLSVTPRHESMLGGEGMAISAITVKAAAP